MQKYTLHIVKRARKEGKFQMVALVVKEKINRRIKNLIDHVESELGIIVPTPTVRYALRGDTAGAAYFHQWAVDFNPILLRHYEEEFVTHTVGHEIAHLVSVAKHGMKIFPHGKEWQRTMRMFELPIRITHRYELGPR